MSVRTNMSIDSEMQHHSIRSRGYSGLSINAGDEKPFVISEVRPHETSIMSFSSTEDLHRRQRVSSSTSKVRSFIRSAVASVRKLRKNIGCMKGFFLLVGIIVGSGIFISPSLVLREVHDVGASLTIWTICGLLALLGALCYCELAVTIKKGGGSYTYALFIYGPLPAFLISWTQVLLIDSTAVAAITLTLGTYVIKPFESVFEVSPWYPKVIAAVCIIIIAIVNCTSTRVATGFQAVFTTCQMLSILFIIILGGWQLGVGRYHNFENFFGNAEFNLSTIGAYGSAFFGALWAYNGWTMVTNITEDMVNVERNMLLSIVFSIPFVIISYIAVNISFLTVLLPAQIGNSAAVAVDFINELFNKKVGIIIPILVALSCYGSANGCMFTCGRASLAAGREGHLPEILGMIHRTRHTPIPSVLVTTSLALLLLLPDSSDLQMLINISSISNWFVYLLTFLGVIVLRYQQPNLHRPFKVYLILPFIMSVVAVILIVIPFMKRPINSALAVGIICLGIPVYYLLIYKSEKHPLWFITFRSKATMFLKDKINLAPCSS